MACSFNKKHLIIHTGTIQVKTITLDNKQLTLSVFRQFKDESIIITSNDEDKYEKDNTTLVGIPIGIVRYVYDKSPVWTDYYLLWNKNGEVRKMACPLSNRIFSRLEEKENTYLRFGCKHCDTDSERSAIRCWICRGKTSSYKYTPNSPILSLFYDYIGEPNNDVEPDNLVEYDKVVIDFLKQFETLDQLYISV